MFMSERTERSLPMAAPRKSHYRYEFQEQTKFADPIR